MTVGAAGSAAVDVIVVGSGASAVHAAFPLIEAGLRVRMLDVGHRGDTYEELVPDRAFLDVHRSDENQWRYFLGERLDGVSLGRTGIGAQLTPPRQHVSRDVARLTPVASETFFPLESLAVGGLASAWGAGCPPFDDADLTDMPMSRADLEPHYASVAERIGISGAEDDLLPFFGPLPGMLPAVRHDLNAESILDHYQSARHRLQRAGFHLGQPRLAMLSRDYRGRRATSYHDMDFWSDAGRSVYRPRWTLEELIRFDRFEYRDGLLVGKFTEDGGVVHVTARRLRDNTVETHTARALILAAGTLGSARIALRSMGAYDRAVPLVCNPHTYAPMINLHRLGASGDDARHSQAQACVVFRDPADGHVTVGHVYSYRSLLAFKLLRESPLAHREGVRVVRELMPSLAILLLQHADTPSSEKRCVLRRAPDGGPDVLEIHYALAPEERRRADLVERHILRHFRLLGCYCIRRVRAGHAASVHYAGTLPMTDRGTDLTTTPDGRLRPTRGVYVADGSVFPHLPSKGLTFTMMANANRIGTRLGSALAGRGP